MDMDLFAGGLQSIGFSNPGPGIEDLFFVSEDTGQVATTSTLDYETAPSHGFELQCSDGSFTTRATVVVTVVPENDNIPVLKLIYTGSMYLVQHLLIGILLVRFLQQMQM